jgi:hypothetical protein
MKNLSIAFSLCGLFFVGGSSSVRADIITTPPIQAAADTTIYSQDDNVSNGGYSLLLVGNADADGGFAQRNAFEVRFIEYTGGRRCRFGNARFEIATLGSLNAGRRRIP